MKEILEQITSFISLPLEDPVLIFSLVLFIILFSPLMANKIKIPHIVVLILAGVVFGPNGLNILENDSSFELFGQVGIIYIMFVAGIDIDLNDFKKHRNKSIVFGLYTFFIPMIMGFATGIALVYLIFMDMANGETISWVTENGLSTDPVNLLRYCVISSIILATMYASNTLIAYPIINRYGVNKQASVNISVGGTMVTTVLALLVLAVGLEASKGSIGLDFWLHFGISAAIFSAIVFFLFPIIGRYFFKRFNDSVLQYIFVLAMIFLASFLAKFVGIEPIIGAFMGGLALNKLVPKRSPLMNRIDFVGNAIFIPFFLIGVGMIVDLSILTESYLTVLAAVVMSIVATSSKYFAAALAKRSFNLNKDEMKMIFGLTNAQAATTLAAVTIAYGIIIAYTADGTPIRLLPEEILNGTIIMILITCTISSIYTENSAKKLALLKEEEDVYAPEHRILIPLSNPQTVDQLMDLAVLLTDKENKQPIYTLSVVDENNQDSEKVLKGKKLMKQAAAIGAATDHKVKRISRYDLNIASGIANVVKEKNISDVVMGLHAKTKLSDSFFGSMTEALLKGVNRSIFISKAIQPLNTIKCVKVAVPAKAEFETGFSVWCKRIFTLAQEDSTELVFYCNEKTQQRIQYQLKFNDTAIKPKFVLFDDWDDFLILSRELSVNDLLVVVVARKQSISYSPLFEKLPHQLTKFFQRNSFIVLYPEQFKEGEIDRTNSIKNI